jgi:hypothetical protein
MSRSQGDIASMSYHQSLTYCRSREFDEVLPMMHAQHGFAVELDNARSSQHYLSLIEQSLEARRQGDHWAAQKLATAAHKWVLQEGTRFRRLTHAREALVSAARQLETAWDKDRDCQTIEDLRERHPEFKRVITVFEEAQARATELENPPVPDDE